MGGGFRKGQNHGRWKGCIWEGKKDDRRVEEESESESERERERPNGLAVSTGAERALGRCSNRLPAAPGAESIIN